MNTKQPPKRVLIVDDNRDGADALGLVVEALGNQVHVTYGGSQALDVATAFRPDLMLIDLAMPEIDGCDLADRFRQRPAFANTRIVAVTGHADEGHRTLAMRAGFDAVIAKPVSLKEFEEVLACVTIDASRPAVQPPNKMRTLDKKSQLPISEARRIRSERKSKTLTKVESEHAVCAGISSFQEEYMGVLSEQIQSHFINDLLVVRIQGTLTLAERQLGKVASSEKGKDLIKQTRRQLLHLARPMLESLVHEVTGVKVQSMHHDISTVTGEEVIIFSLIESPRFN